MINTVEIENILKFNKHLNSFYTYTLYIIVFNLHVFPLLFEHLVLLYIIDFTHDLYV